MTSSGALLAQEGSRLVQDAAGRGFPLRLTGGVAIWIRSSGQTREALGRAYPDLDLVAHRKHSYLLPALLEGLGYQSERRFNAVHGDRRLIYHAADGSYHLDIFLDGFEMSHKLDLGRRLEVEDLTLPAAELLLTKLQVAELNRKDISDTVMLLSDHELADKDGAGRLSVGPVVELCAADWCLFTTATDNLAKTRELLPELLADDGWRSLVASRVDELQRRLETVPKTMSWKLRARVGRRVRWYETPEEVAR